MNTHLITFIEAPKCAAPSLETRRVFCGWGFGRPDFYDLPIVPVRYVERRGGGWWLVVEYCPLCGQEHKHGSNRDADWAALNHINPIEYAQQPHGSHCPDLGQRSVYVFEITVGLPREVREVRHG